MSNKRMIDMREALGIALNIVFWLAHASKDFAEKGAKHTEWMAAQPQLRELERMARGGNGYGLPDWPSLEPDSEPAATEAIIVATTAVVNGERAGAV